MVSVTKTTDAEHEDHGRESKKKGLLLIGVILLSVLFYSAWQYSFITAFGASVRPKKSDIIIVLGAQVWGDKSSPGSGPGA